MQTVVLVLDTVQWKYVNLCAWGLLYWMQCFQNCSTGDMLAFPRSTGQVCHVWREFTNTFIALDCAAWLTKDEHQSSCSHWLVTSTACYCIGVGVFFNASLIRGVVWSKIVLSSTVLVSLTDVFVWPRKLWHHLGILLCIKMLLCHLM